MHKEATSTKGSFETRRKWKRNQLILVPDGHENSPWKFSVISPSRYDKATFEFADNLDGFLAQGSSIETSFLFRTRWKRVTREITWNLLQICSRILNPSRERWETFTRKGEAVKDSRTDEVRLTMMVLLRARVDMIFQLIAWI